MCSILREAYPTRLLCDSGNKPIIFHFLHLDSLGIFVHHSCAHVDFSFGFNLQISVYYGISVHKAVANNNYDLFPHLTVSVDVFVTFVTDSIFIIITLKLVGDVRTVITIVAKWITIVVVLGWVKMAWAVVLGKDSMEVPSVRVLYTFETR